MCEACSRRHFAHRPGSLAALCLSPLRKPRLRENRAQLKAQEGTLRYLTSNWVAWAPAVGNWLSTPLPRLYVLGSFSFHGWARGAKHSQVTGNGAQ